MIKILRHYWIVLRDKGMQNFDNVRVKGRNIYNMENFSEYMTFVHRKLKMLFLAPAIMVRGLRG